MKEIINCGWKIGDDAIHIMERYKRVYLQDGVRPIIKCKSLEFILLPIVQNCQIQSMCLFHHLCCSCQKISRSSAAEIIKGINQLLWNCYKACIVFDFL